jgi:uncharacterized protein (TIGR03083 family)
MVDHMATTTTNQRPREAEAFLTALHDLSPDAPTACEDWTVHDVAAHVAGVYAEVLRHVTAYADGHPLSRTRGFEEREARFRALPADRLSSTVDEQETLLRHEIAAVLADDPGAELAWTGRRMRVASFPTHLRSECALHRWDLLGDDETSADLLGDNDLLEHAVTAIGAGPLLARGVEAGAADGPETTARVRTGGRPDLVVTLGQGAAGLAMADPAGDAVIVADQAARLLLLWGRAPSPATRVRTEGADADALRVRRLFAGY